MADPDDVLPADESVESAESAESAEPAEPKDLADTDDAANEVGGRLPSFEGVNLSVGQFMAGLEQKILHNRPPAVVVVQEQARGEQVQTNGLVIGNLPTEPLDRPEPPDDSGVTL